MTKKTITYLASLNDALHELLSSRDNVIVLGEDIRDPYGGAFKVTKGLSDKYSDRVINTPISEAAITGIGIGLALQGMRPIVEIMFGDFMALTVDQILNSASKFGLMYGKSVTVPLVIRTPMGGGRGYGPTHSQSIEKIFFGMPGVKVVSPGIAHNPKEILLWSVNDNGVVIFVEDKKMYNQSILADTENNLIIKNIIHGDNTIAIVENDSGNKADITILSYGGLSIEIIKLVVDLFAEEINIKAIFPSIINDLQFISSDAYEMMQSEYGFLVVEPGVGRFGWGGEVIAKLYEEGFLKNHLKAKQLSSHNGIIPSAKELEQQVLVNYSDIFAAVMEIME